MDTAEQTFAAVYTQHLPAVTSYLVRRVEWRFVEDIAADVFAVAWQKRDRVAAGEELPWLYRIAANLVANHRRKQASGASLIASLRPSDSAPSAEDIVIADVALAAAWKQLRVKDREVIALATFEELPLASVASVLGISVNATSIRLHRAKKQLAELLSAQPDSPISERSGLPAT
jgi:RNA polymerase sigma-70 factor (ECF subfamily)